MFFPTRSIFICSICLILAQVGCPFKLQAQAGNAEELITQVNLWFLFLDESAGAFYLKSPQGYELLSGSPYSVEGSRAFRPGEKIEIYKKAPNLEPVVGAEREQSVRRVKIAEMTAPMEIRAALAVLAPISAGLEQANFKVRLYEAPPVDSEHGSIQMINLGRSRTAAALGATRVVLQVGEMRVIQAPTDTRNRFKVQVADNLGGEWEVIDRRVVFLRPGERLTGVFVYSPSGMKHTYSRSELLSMGEDPAPCHAWLQFKQ